MRRVLLINDSKLENAIMKDMLNSIDYNVSIADEYNAIAAVNEFCPDYVIANYIMKDINGYQLAAIIKTRYPDIKCIISSSNPIDINDFDRKKINAVIRTPIERAELKRVLEGIAKENIKKYEISDSFEKNKFCKQCGKFLNLSLNSYFFCPFCGSRI